MVDSKYESPTQRRSIVRTYSPRKDDSPSRQLGFELDKALEKLQIHDLERRKVHAYNRRSYHEELDAKDLAMAKAHMEALEAASAKHEAVRQEAEAVLHKYLKEQEDRRRREEEEERQRQEREAREKAERERRAKEEAERKIRIERERQEAEARRVAEEKARAEAAEAAEAERKQRQAQAQKEKEDSLRAAKDKAEKDAATKAQSEKEAAEKARVQQAQQAAAAIARPSATTPSQPGFYAASPEAEAIHKEYLALHKKIKDFRKDFWQQAKQDKNLKTIIGDMRRAMRTSVGQLTDDKVGNKKASERVKTAINQALEKIPSPEVSISDYLPPHLSLNDQGSTKIRSLVIYLLSVFSKAIINAFVGECAVSTKAAESIGTLAAQVFSLPELQFTRLNTTTSQTNASLISILLAKYHKAAPILFGISGPETTAAGRIRIGWRMEPLNDPDKKTFVTEQRQYERMTGLGAGYASIALRNFSKARLRNPFPPTHFWASLAGIVNTPPADVQTSHMLLLKAMLENNASERFVLFYGNVAVAALRQAIVEFPKTLPAEMRAKPATRSVMLMADMMAKEKHFRLE